MYAEKAFINSVTEDELVITTGAVGIFNMFFVLVFFAGAVISEAGVVHQSNRGFGLHYHPGGGSSQAVRPAIIRSHISPPFELSPALNQGSVFTSALFTSPIVLNTALTSHAALAPPTTTRIAPPLLHPVPINHGAIGNTLISSHTVHNPTIIGNYEIIQEIQERPEKSVSYSLSENDYNYLKRHKTEGQDSPYNPIPGLDTASPSEKHQNPHRHHSKDQDVTRSSKSDNVLKRSAASSEAYQGYNEPSLINVPEPVVTKHIYFHVPPPDFEEPSLAPISVPLPKKTYNIVFIKVPAQEQQNYAYLQQLLQSRQSHIEDKTLIYVLSKKQKPSPQVVLAPQQTSSPEVFFVNYKTKPEDITGSSNEFVAESILEDIYPVLERKRRLGDSQSDSQRPEK
ncbi:Cuticular protein PxutCPT5 [Operophtera brumata]|uniref:Cuticular protein PxutCPT5 n=1 Tax=Operophtera brumata TaxID=104452 RepID=A0A0L7LRF1_OPEBR|nr:Cuticular protein PxutCPT5 [Operophtera brumata]